MLDTLNKYYSFITVCYPSVVQYGFATFLISTIPVSGSLYSFQLTGYMVLPLSLVAMMTPNSFLAVER